MALSRLHLLPGTVTRELTDMEKPRLFPTTRAKYPIEIVLWAMEEPESADPVQ